MTTIAQENVFAAQVFEPINPSTLVQRDWLNDEPFVALLQESWTQQYAEYIGSQAARTLVNTLIDSGEILAHDPSLTLLATNNQKNVGIAALRRLSGLSLITMLEVVPACQGKGIGHQLMAALETASDRLMAHVSIHRPAVAHFYASQGFHRLQRTRLDHYGHELEFDVMAKTTQQ